VCGSKYFDPHTQHPDDQCHAHAISVASSFEKGIWQGLSPRKENGTVVAVPYELTCESKSNIVVTI
jgi:hypothetical protein